MSPLSPLACRLIAIALMAGGAMAVATAQTERRSTQVWRCGPEGRELRDAPCPESGAGGTPGQQRIDYDQPSSAQSAEARRIATREAKLARELERDRQRLEAQQARQQQAIGIHGRGKPPPPDAAQGAASAPLKTKKPKTHKPKPPKTNANTSG